MRSRHLLAVILFALVLLTAVGFSGCEKAPELSIPHHQVVVPGATHTVEAQAVHFCFWNMENLFDDALDPRPNKSDEEYDRWFARDASALALKLSKHADALFGLNDGKGPDILAMCEVESVRAAELLQRALNARIADPALHYQAPLMKEISVGRHIAPAILTRLPSVRDKTRNFGSRFRILQAHLHMDGHELIVLASHWTSRLQGGEKQRAEYADKLYGAAYGICKANPQADILICGDFNDTPGDASVMGNLHATGDLQAVRSGAGALQLFNLFAGKDAARGFGTHYYNGFHVFDQVVVSPGMLDNVGWTCEPASAQTVQTLRQPGERTGRPWRFGGERDLGPRGYSDHFPIAVRLNVRR